MDIKEYNGTSLAYMGDAVMSLLVREMLLAQGWQKSKILQKKSESWVSAKAQAYYKTWELEELLESVPQGKQPLLVMLDGLEDPHNLGAILRTCDCIRADGVIIGKHRNVRLTPTVAKVSTGAIDTVKVSVVTNLVQAIKYLKKQGYWVVGTDFENSRDYREGQYDVPLVLVIGSEGFGISSLVKKNCDYCVRLPMEGSVSSLNASVAAGILLYQIHAQRHPL